MKDFNTFLEELRTERNLSKKELATLANLSAGYISLLTRGERETPSEETVEALAGALKIEGEVKKQFFESAGYYVRSRSSLKSPLRQIDLNGQREESASKKDWSEAPDVRFFYGRQKELATLKQWVIDNDCRVVAVLGIGGIGKTSLTAKLIENVEDTFEYVYWRSLQNPPSLASLLEDCIRFITQYEYLEIPKDQESLILLLINYLQRHRCLLIFDNIETLLQEKQRVGRYKPEYEGYGNLFSRLGQAQHKSCLILTSREKPREISQLEGTASLVRSWQLSGIAANDGKEIFRDLVGADETWEKLIKLYAGNPLALKLVSGTIREVFGGDIATFLEEGKAVIGDIYGLLDTQFSRLTVSEQEILYWIAIEREAVSLQILRENIGRLVSWPVMVESLDSLRRRSFVDSPDRAIFTLQPVIMEFVTERLVTELCKELETENFALFASHALIKAQAKDNVRNSQLTFILQPIKQWMLGRYTKAGSERKLKNIIVTLQRDRQHIPEYVAGNILNLLIALGCNLNGWDFSHLMVWQAFLRDAPLHKVNFAYADLTGSVFTEAFGTILSVIFNPDGELLAAGTSTGEVRLWEATTGIPVRICLGHSGWIYSVAFSPDGQRLASGSEDRTVRLWEVSTGRCLTTFSGHENRIWSVAFSPDQRLLASGSHDGTIRLWDTSTEQCIKVLQAPKERIWCIAFSPDGNILASGSDVHTIRVWDVTTGECVKVLQGHTGWIRSVAFNRNGLLASGSEDQTVRLWDINTGKCINILRGHSNRVTSVGFSPDGEMLASSSDDETIQLWSVSDGQLLRPFVGHTNWVGSVTFSTDGKTLASSSYDQTVRLWQVSSGESIKQLLGYALLMEAVSFSPDGRLLASGSDDNIVRIWDVSSGQHIKTLEGHTGWIRGVAFSPNGRLLASGSDDGTARIWEVSSGKCLYTLHGHSNRVWSVDFSPDSRLLASGSEDQTIRLWDVETGKELNMLRGHDSWIWSVAFSPDGHTLASGSADYTIGLWDVNSGQQVKRLKGHSNRVWSVTFNPNGEILASASEDQTVRLWDLKTGKELKTLSGHTGYVWSVAFSTDGNTLASGSDDYTIRLWDTSSGQCSKVLRGHTNQIKSVAFNPDGKMLASGSHDGTSKLWDIYTGECLQTLTSPRPYEGMDITHISGITEPQKAMLKALGAIER